MWLNERLKFLIPLLFLSFSYFILDQVSFFFTSSCIYLSPSYIFFTFNELLFPHQAQMARFAYFFTLAFALFFSLVVAG